MTEKMNKGQLLSEIAELRQKLSVLEESLAHRILPEKRFDVLDTIDDMVAFQDTDMHLLWVNQAAAASVRSAPEALVGKRCYQIWHNRKAPCPGCPILKVHSTGKKQSAEMATSDGRHWLVRGLPLLDDEGNVTGVIEITSDITRHRKNEEELLVRARMLDSASDGICLINPGGEFIYANDMFCTVHGFTRDELIGKNIREIDTNKTEEWYKWLSSELREKGSLLFETTHYRRDGSVFNLEVNSSEVESGGQRYLLSVERDITERKKADETIRGLYEKESTLRQELEEEIEKRVTFTRMLIHELKTPLTPMIAASDIITESVPEGPLRRAARSIYNGSQMLSRRIDTLIDAAKGELGMLQMNLESINPLDTLKSVAEDTAPLAQRRHQILKAELPDSLPDIFGDEERLRQVVVNLLDNSLKFTPSGGTITLRARKERKKIVIEVEDTGPGIPAEQQSHLFQAYHRGADPNQHGRGLGLGLSLAKIIIELHGGTIRVESREGKGSTFSVFLPVPEKRKRG
ncbi:MAG: PAS domain-containing sensor histidine kinase [Dehalococcoidales bacterium]|nr:PAS domain-containing sensor histidine kinase [Dehalococcoidales bacterium]